MLVVLALLLVCSATHIKAMPDTPHDGHVACNPEGFASLSNLRICSNACDCFHADYDCFYAPSTFEPRHNLPDPDITVSFVLILTTVTLTLEISQHAFRTRLERLGKDTPSLCLYMIVRDEYNHLQNNLPIWAKMVDCYVIGVDHRNTDDSERAIVDAMKGIPGKVVATPWHGFSSAWNHVINQGVHYVDRCECV